VWRPLARIEAGTEQTELSDTELGALLDAGDPVPAWFTPENVAAELRRARPPRRERGLVVFFTGLSGSGKSTVARAVAARLGVAYLDTGAMYRSVAFAALDHGVDWIVLNPLDWGLEQLELIAGEVLPRVKGGSR